MITSDVMGALRRRWYLVLVGLVGTGALLWAMLPMVPVTYQAKALIVLLPPRNIENIGGNPYLALGGLESVTGVLSRSMTADDVVEQVRGVAPEVAYTVEPDLTTSGPILLITAEAQTPDDALAAVDELLAVAPREMVDLQRANDVPEESLISTSVVTSDKQAQPQRKAQIRAVLTVGVGSLAGTILGIALLDRMLLRRRESRSLRMVAKADVPDEAERASPPSGPRAHQRRTGKVGAPARPTPTDEKRPSRRTGPDQTGRPAAAREAWQRGDRQGRADARRGTG